MKTLKQLQIDGEYDNIAIDDEAPECTENLCCPKFQPTGFSTFIYTTRYNIIKYLCCPLPLIPYLVPVFGGRTIIEWVIFIIVAIVFILSSSRTGNVTGSGGNVSLVAAFAVAFSFRSNNVLTFLFGISFERAIFWHKIFAVLALLLGVIHGVAAGFKGGIYGRTEDGFGDQRRKSGTILLLLMSTTSLLYLVKYFFFESFYYFHVTLYLVIVYFAMSHGATELGLVVIVWAVDLAVRYYFTLHSIQATFELMPTSTSTTTSANATASDAVCDDVIKISFPKPFHYNALQYVFISIPELSYFEYHPFSISSAPHEPMVTIHIRVLGNWTKKLQTLCRTKKCNNNNNNNNTITTGNSNTEANSSNNMNGNEISINTTLKALIEGPYGLPSINLKKSSSSATSQRPPYEVYLLLAGGIGVTPIRSVYKDILYRHRKNKWPLRKLILIWCVRDKNMLKIMDLSDSSSISDNSHNTANANNNNNNDNDLIISPLHMNNNSSNSSSSTCSMDSRLPVTVTSTSSTNDDIENGKSNQTTNKIPNILSNTHHNLINNNHSNISSFHPFHVEYYVTKPKYTTPTTLRTDNKGSNNNNHNHNDDINPVIHHGRPNLNQLFQQVVQLCASDNSVGDDYNASTSSPQHMDNKYVTMNTASIKRVAVIMCGPLGMIAEVSDLCRLYNSRTTTNIICGKGNNTMKGKGGRCDTKGSSNSGGGVVEGSVYFDLHIEEFNL